MRADETPMDASAPTCRLGTGIFVPIVPIRMGPLLIIKPSRIRGLPGTIHSIGPILRAPIDRQSENPRVRARPQPLGYGEAIVFPIRESSAVSSTARSLHLLLFSAAGEALRKSRPGGFSAKANARVDFLGVSILLLGRTIRGA
jgi:hypothetical protein